MSKFQDIINNIDLILEKKRKKRVTNKKTVNKKSKENRKKRAENVKITNHDTSSRGTFTLHTCNAESAEKTESSSHKCHVTVINKTGDIKDVSCSCSDFQSRYQYHRNKEGISEWGGVKPFKDIFDPHTREQPDVMNPNNDGYVCKHLIAFINKIKNNGKA